MRIRLTRNMDKERGFVNGAMATVETVLRKDVFIAKTASGVRFLVHPVAFDKQQFVPFCYGYAMTIRRAQGSTLDLVGLWFATSTRLIGATHMWETRECARLRICI